MIESYDSVANKRVQICWDQPVGEEDLHCRLPYKHRGKHYGVTFEGAGYWKNENFWQRHFGVKYDKERYIC